MSVTTRRVVGSIAVCALALGVAACSSDEEAEGLASEGPDSASFDGRDVGAMEDFGVGDTFTATEPVSFSLLYRDHPNYPLDEDWLLFDEVAERNNVSFDITTAPLSDWAQRRSLLIGAGDAPAIIPVTYASEEAPFVASGAILPVSDYVGLMPNFQDKVESWGLEEEIDTLRQEDGKYYLLPGILETVRPDYTLGMRIDQLEAAGVAEPTSWEEVSEALAAMKEANPADYAMSDRWEGLSLLNVAAPTFGTSAGWGYGAGVTWDPEAEEFVYTAATEEYRQLLEYFAGLVADGLLDPESFTQDDDSAAQKLANEQSFAITTNAQEIIAHRTTLETSLGGEPFELQKIPVPEGPAGDFVGGTRLESGIAISSEAAESENFVAMMQFIDWLYYSDEGLEFARWGVEGETFERDGDTRVLAADVDLLGQNPEGSTNLQTDYGFFNGVFSLAHGSTQDLLLTHLSEEEVAWQEAMADKERVEVPPPYPLDELEREQVSLYQTALTDYVNQNTLQFILGQRDLSEFDDFVTELEANNMTTYLDVVNAAQERYEQNNA